MSPRAEKRTYTRREPERTVLHRVVREDLETWLERRRASHPDGAGVPRFVERELRAFLRCGILAHGFARFRCEGCGADRLVAFSCKGRGVCPSCGGRRMTERAADLVDRVLPHVRHRQWVLSLPFWLRWRMAWDHDLTRRVLRIFIRVVFGFYRARGRRLGARAGRTGSVTVIQRFGGALNLNVHFHTVIPDGVWTDAGEGELRFVRIAAPTEDELEALRDTVAARVRRLLIRRGLWHEDDEGGQPAETDDAPPIADLYEASVAQRAENGRPLPRVGATVPLEPDTRTAARARVRGGFDLHAGVTVGARRRDRLEHLCRYLLRPALANDRLQSLPNGELLLALKKRWADGTSHLRLTKRELLDRLAAIIPRPRTNQVLYHGVFAANAAWRARIVPEAKPARPRASAPTRPNHTWADLMKRGLDLDVLQCPRACGARLRLVALIEKHAVVQRVLRHLGLPSVRIRPDPARPPPESEHLDWAS